MIRERNTKVQTLRDTLAYCAIGGRYDVTRVPFILLFAAAVPAAPLQFYKMTCNVKKTVVICFRIFLW